jgi:hypothetical protein
MLDFFSVATSTLYSTSNEQPLVGIPEYVVNDEDKGDGDGDNSYVSNLTPYTGHTSFPNVQTDSSASIIDLPLVSKVFFFIYNKKVEFNRLLQKKKR